MLDAVDDLFVFVKKDQIAVFSHQLYDERVTAQVSHLIEMFDFKTKDPLQTRLCDRDDPAVLQVLAQKHTESGCLKRCLPVPGSDICKGEGGVRRQIKPALAAAALRDGFECKDQLIAVRLCDLIDSGACESVREFPAQAGSRDSVKSHGYGSFLIGYSG